MELMYLEWITAGLHKVGKSKSGLARALGVNPAQITRLLHGTRELKTSELKMISNYLEEPIPQEGGGTLTQTYQSMTVTGPDAELVLLETLSSATSERIKLATKGRRRTEIYRVTSRAVDVYYGRGTIVVVDLEQRWKPREIVLAQTADGRLILRQALDPGLVAPTLDDPKPPTIIPNRDGTQIMGVVIDGFQE